MNLRHTIRLRLGLCWSLGLVLALSSPSHGDPWLVPTTDGRLPELPLLDSEVPSPADVLGYPLGERFTPQAELLRYLEELAAASPRAHLARYGTSYEGRPLSLLFVSSPANLSRLEEIAERRRVLNDPHGLTAIDEDPDSLLPVVLWMGYGVHGNESSSSEAALATAYLLTAGLGDTRTRLDDVLVIIEPLLNPDGRERYVQAFRQRRGVNPNPDPVAAEHVEPWPGGRGNHYGLDLNRDWAWATQRETQRRLEVFSRWEPQVAVDFHEMGASSTYFFPPPAEPVHPRIDDRARGWLEAFGRENARAFDRIGWTYYVEEQFDLFYPGYGDSYPTLRGGVGMTYEVGGGGQAGTVIDLGGGRTRSLADRIARHLTTALATFATTADHGPELLDDFTRQRQRHLSEPGLTFLWPPEGEGRALAELLTRHGIVVDRLGRDRTDLAQPLLGGPPARSNLSAGSFVVSTRQPLGGLAAALLEREARVQETFVERQRRRVDDDLEAEFYDVTAWSLPLSFNVDARRIEGFLPGDQLRRWNPGDPEPVPTALASTIGFVVPPSGLASYRFAGELWQAGIHFRVAGEELELDGRSLGTGTLLVAREDQSGALWDGLVDRLSQSRDPGVEVLPVETSWTLRGLDLGSERFPIAPPPSVGIVGGAGILPTSFGALWHLFDVELEVPHSVVDVDTLQDSAIDAFDHLILPDGWDFSRLESVGETLGQWIRSGGTLIAIGEAGAWVKASSLTSENAAVEPKDDTAPRKTPSADTGDPDHEFRLGAAHSIPGALVASELERGSVTRGVPRPPYWIYLGRPTSKDSRPEEKVLARVARAPRAVGFTWPEGAERLPGAPLIRSLSIGEGRVIIFDQDPVFRLLTRGTIPFLLNAALFEVSE